MGTFDPAAFLDVSLTEANDTTPTQVPVGEYTAVAGAPAVRDGTDKNGKPWAALDIPWTIDGGSYPDVQKETGRDKNIVRQSIFLDIGEGGGLDVGRGKNVSLGRLREALGLNKPGAAFSLRQLEGRVAKVKVEHRMYEGQTFADVKGVAPA